ncbi:MAG: hypothetical protein ABSG03_12040 [Bryobacteraceae bacterium]|jgi:hypothetical protein
MKSVFVALALALAVSHAQAPQRVAMHPPAAVAVAATHIPLGMLANLEHNFDQRLEAMDGKDPLDWWGWGGTRGLYIEGFGTVFTTELSLIVTPGVSPFRPTISDELKLQVHQRKLAHLTPLEDLMKDLMKVSALTLSPLPDDQKIVFAVRVRYLSWEDTKDLPAQILMTADKKSAILGDIRTKVE